VKEMNKKLVYNCSTQNLCFGILTIFATLSFMMQICNALLIIKGGGALNNVQYTIFELKISITRDTYSHIYKIVNYPLIPILGGVIYNIYNIARNHWRKEKTDSLLS
jgi:hypothetical protein